MTDFESQVLSDLTQLKTQMHALLGNGQLLIAGAGGAAVPASVNHELVMIQPAVLENAHWLASVVP